MDDAFRIRTTVQIDHEYDSTHLLAEAKRTRRTRNYTAASYVTVIEANTTMREQRNHPASTISFVRNPKKKGKLTLVFLVRGVALLLTIHFIVLIQVVE